MRILINGWFSDQLAAGSGQYLAALAEWLPRVGGEHEFVLVRRGGAGERGSGGAGAQGGAKAISNFQSPISNIQRRTLFDGLSPNLAKLWFEQIAFPLACRRLRADVAFVPYWGAAFWSPCPVVVTVHDLIPLLLPLYRGGLLQRAYTTLVGHTARRAAAVLTDSEASKRDIVARLGIPAARVHAIPLAADPRFRPVTDPAELARVAAKYRLPDEPFLLYLGGFDARKNVGRMVEAFAGIAQNERRKTKLVIAGKLPETDTSFAPDPRRVVAALGLGERVHFTGWVDEADKPALYSLAHGVVFASEYEGFGLQVLEAMACDAAISPSAIRYSRFFPFCTCR